MFRRRVTELGRREIRLAKFRGDVRQMEPARATSKIPAQSGGALYSADDLASHHETRSKRLCNDGKRQHVRMSSRVTDLRALF
jgi:hypothetical protein